MKLISNIEKIKILTETLANRDAVRVKILELFDIFCKDFPIRINAWIMDETRNVISRNATPTNGNRVSIDEIFSEAAREKNIKMHERALRGETVTYIIRESDTVYLTKLLPTGKKSKMIFGVSVDISSYSHAVDALDAHCEDSKSKNCTILEKVKNDDLYKIIKAEG
tara:strand:+ start:524 stop:1024 length:501 start_codon:yes stop_codon:yes gene_type:complete